MGVCCYYIHFYFNRKENGKVCKFEIIIIIIKTMTKHLEHSLASSCELNIIARWIGSPI